MEKTPHRIAEVRKAKDYPSGTTSCECDAECYTSIPVWPYRLGGFLQDAEMGMETWDENKVDQELRKVLDKTRGHSDI
jgi:hypothetical protein